jgi:hypothetical protein
LLPTGGTRGPDPIVSAHTPDRSARNRSAVSGTHSMAFPRKIRSCHSGSRRRANAASSVAIRTFHGHRRPLVIARLRANPLRESGHHLEGAVATRARHLQLDDEPVVPRNRSNHIRVHTNVPTPEGCVATRSYRATSSTDCSLGGVGPPLMHHLSYCPTGACRLRYAVCQLSRSSIYVSPSRAGPP